MSLQAMHRYEKEVRRISPGRLENKQRLITVNNDKAQRKIDIARKLFGESREGKSLTNAFQKMVQVDEQGIDFEAAKKLHREVLP